MKRGKKKKKVKSKKEKERKSEQFPNKQGYQAWKEYIDILFLAKCRSNSQGAGASL